MKFIDITNRIKTIPMESSDDAIKRGVDIQTTFYSESKRKRVKSTTHIVIEVEKDYNSQVDNCSANDYLRAKQLGMV